jgi:lipopolysaccharide export system permease protein
MFKKIDKYLLLSFMPPFVLMFGIAMFAFVLQFLWLYIDEIMSRGADLVTLTELIFYLSVTFIPTSLPVGVLVASVMVMGNLAERYELSSFKSAGVSLPRIIVPLVAFCIGVGAFSYLCSNTLIPLSNLKFQARFYDLRRQKPVLALDQGVFNDAFSGYTIWIGQKDDNSGLISDVVIYDNQSAAFGKYNMIYAKTGTMRTTPDKQFFVMSLQDGYQINEVTESRYDRRGHPQYLRTSFKSWRKVFDLGQFASSASDESIFSKNQKTQSVGELQGGIDTLRMKISSRHDTYYEQLNQYYRYKKDSLNKPTIIRQSVSEQPQLSEAEKMLKLHRKNRPKIVGMSDLDMIGDPTLIGEIMQYQGGAQKPTIAHISDIDSLSVAEKSQLYQQALTQVRNLKEGASSVQASIRSYNKTISGYAYEMHQKFALAVSCLIFLFVGAPMGAIVRKGGFGWPLLIAIMCFALFIVLNLMGKSFIKSEALGPIESAWLPVAVFIPISSFLMYGAIHDYSMSNLTESFRPVARPFVWVFKFISARFTKKT